MRRKVLLIAAFLALPAIALAHLCNDVFVQAKDNMVVKVDIRDGQLRVGQKGSFRVYLLNTMDRGIANIKLEVLCEQFNADVKPSETWRKFPQLQTTRRGGKKEYFTVALERKPGVPDGKYKIRLRLFNGKKKSMEFVTVDMDAAAGLYHLPKAEGVKIDGQADQAEWGKAFAATDFHAYVPSKKNKKFFVNEPAKDQTRFRLSCDGKFLYALFNFQGGAGAASDEATLYVASSVDGKPAQLSIDRLTGKVTCEKGIEGVEAKVSADKNLVECKLPLALLGVGEGESFRANCTRTITADGEKSVTYWRGNAHSVADAMVYGQFRLAEEE